MQWIKDWKQSQFLNIVLMDKTQNLHSLTPGFPSFWWFFVNFRIFLASIYLTKMLIISYLSFELPKKLLNSIKSLRFLYHWSFHILLLIAENLSNFETIKKKKKKKWTNSFFYFFDFDMSTCSTLRKSKIWLCIFLINIFLLPSGVYGIDMITDMLINTKLNPIVTEL